MNIPPLTDRPLHISSQVRALRDDFPGSELDPAAWAVLAQGPGQTITVADGNLSLSAGTTADAETIIRSRFYFTVPFRVWFLASLSQRIANQEFFLEATNDAGDMVARWAFSGTSATSSTVETCNGGSSNDASQIITSTAVLTIFEIQLFCDEAWLSQRWVNSSAAKTYGNPRQRCVPDPNEYYFLQIRVKNGATPPASATTLTLDAIVAQDVNELSAEITSGQGDITGGRGISVNPTALVVGSSLIGDVSPGVRATSANAMLAAKILAAAGTNATVVKNSAGRLYGWSLANHAAAARFVKIFNMGTAPSVGTDTPAYLIGIPPGESVAVQVPPGVYLSAGISLAITTGFADADAGACAAGDVTGTVFYA